MRLLLDSHVALWWLDDSDELGPTSREHIGDAEEAFFSAVTPWELGMKKALGKLSFPDGLVDALVHSGFEPLSIGPTHAETAPTLPLHHRDPFDRMLIAQAQLESLTLVTADERLSFYDVPVVDARS